MSTRYQHIRFYQLKIAEDFFFGKFRYTKAGFFTGRTVLDGRAVVVMPWKKVRSTRPYGPIAPRIVGHVARVLAVNAPYLTAVNETRPPEAPGGSEKCPSA